MELGEAAARFTALTGFTVWEAVPADAGFSARTALISSVAGRFVYQEHTDLTRAERRVQNLAALDPVRSVGVPVPRLAAADFLEWPVVTVTPALPGRTAQQAVGPDYAGAQFPVLAESMGRMLRRIQSVPAADLALPRTWADPEAVRAEAHDTIRRLGPALPPRSRAALGAMADALPRLLAGREPVLAHGDYGPQNVLVDERGEVSGVLDWEDARIADPALDLAWWLWLVRFHMPRAFRVGWPALLDGYGADRSDPHFRRRLMVLLALRLLEATRTFGTTEQSTAEWVARLTRTLRWASGPRQGQEAD